MPECQVDQAQALGGLAGASPTPSSSSNIATPSNQIFVKVEPLSKLFSSDTGLFPVSVRGLLRKPICDDCLPQQCNLILHQAFKTKSDCHCISAYNAIMIDEIGFPWSLRQPPNPGQMRPAPLIRKPSPSSGMPNISYSLPTCAAATKWSVPFTHSRTTSWLSRLALIPPTPRTFGTCYSTG
jgi:hypothetical protein